MSAQHPWRAVALAAALFAACAATADEPAVTAMDDIGESYVKLVLATGLHDSGYVDAYYGPQAWRDEAEAEAPALSAIRGRATTLLDELDRTPVPASETEALRRRYLATQLGSLVARIDLLNGKRLTFDQESLALYGAVAPQHDDAYFQEILDELEPLLPGNGPLSDRYGEFLTHFVIPPERLDTVFRAAIEACRARTAAHLNLPTDESFVLEYVRDKPWGAYNWYQGGYRSLIQVNTDLPIYIDRAIDLACHEGYPGHHVYNLSLERALVRERGWPEFQVYALFSPQSLIAEGTANYGIEVAFPGESRSQYEREVLFPLAGLDPSSADTYHAVQELVEKLGYAGNEAARRYVDGKIDADAAAEWLMRYAMMTPDRARQRMRFIDQYGAYVINYNLGQDLVRAYVERRSGGDPDRTWDEFATLLASPRLPPDL